jgi:hypothetical protein
VAESTGAHAAGDIVELGKENLFERVLRRALRSKPRFGAAFLWLAE